MTMESVLRISTTALLASLVVSVPVIPGAVVKWIPGGEHFRYGVEEVTLEHGATLAMQCDKTDHMSFYKVTREEMEECEPSMWSPIVGTCGGRGGSTTIRQVMKTVAAGAHDLLWPAGTYYIIAIPGYQMQHLPDKYFCQLGMKLKINVVPSGSFSVPYPRLSFPTDRTSSVAGQGPVRRTFQFLPQDAHKMAPQQLTTENRQVVHYPTHVERPVVSEPYSTFPRIDNYPVMRDSPFAKSRVYARDDPRVVRRNPKYHRMVVHSHNPVPIPRNDWTLKAEPFVKASGSRSLTVLFVLPMVVFFVLEPALNVGIFTP